MSRLIIKRVSVLVVILIAIGSVLFWGSNEKDIIPVVVDDKKEEMPTSPEIVRVGISKEGREISAYKYGNGETNLLLVGGIHGGYEWNTVVLAYKFVDYLNENPEFVPDNISITVIPSLNPDGVYKVTGKEGRFEISDVSKDEKVLASGRFNANNVDLNRNFDCKWKPEGTWRSQTVNAGTKAFSEVETSAFRDFILGSSPKAVVFWHSQANAVYASECKDGVLPETLDIVRDYAKASGYTPHTTFDSYEVVGDADGYLASIGIPAVSVELKTHEVIEWEKNLAGVKAVLEYYKKKL